MYEFLKKQLVDSLQKHVQIASRDTWLCKLYVERASRILQETSFAKGSVGCDEEIARCLRMAYESLWPRFGGRERYSELISDLELTISHFEESVPLTIESLYAATHGRSGIIV